MSIRNYPKLLARLLPTGWVWNTSTQSALFKLLEGMGAELERIDDLGVIMHDEADPRSASYLLNEWEQVVQIPDSCQDKASTVAVRRQDVTRKLTLAGGQSPAFFEELAAKFGYTVIVEEYRPHRAGIGTAGQPIYNDDWKFYWGVRAEAVKINHFVAGIGLAGEPLATWENDVLENVIKRSSPAHTTPIFYYGG